MYKLQYERRKKEPRSQHDRMMVFVHMIRIVIFVVMAGAIVVGLFLFLSALGVIPHSRGLPR